MPEDGFRADGGTRKLAAIMFTDLVGYTSLGQRRESLSLALVEEQRKLVRPILRKHGGREVKTIGDAFLVEFPNALDAVRCAYDVQRAVRELNFSLPDESKIHLRIGIHLGDVVVEAGGDVSGDAVNVASRIESLAEDGGVCLTREVYAQVGNKFDLPLRSLGPKSLKNVKAPLEVYKVAMPWEGKAAQPQTFDASRIAVLPFTNMSPDPSDEYFSDGMTEELISTLSRIGGLKVIARTSVVGYKGSGKKVREIGNELEVGAILEGSVRKAGSKVRITAQLINTANEEHLWSANYDRTLDDIFSIQSDVAAKVAGSLPAVLFPPKAEAKKDTEDSEAYTLYLKGVQLIHQQTEESLREAIELLGQAVSRDPNFARAYASLSQAWTDLSGYGGQDLAATIRNAESAARDALRLGPQYAEAHSAMASAYSAKDRHAESVAEAEEAVRINPNLVHVHFVLGLHYAVSWRLERALEAFQREYELDPLSFVAGAEVAFALAYSGRGQEALAVLDKLRRVHPRKGMASVVTARVLLTMNEYDEAEKMLDAADGVEPNLPLGKIVRGLLYEFTGRRSMARRTLAEVEEDKNVFMRLTARLHLEAAAGNLDAAFAALGELAENHSWDWMTLYNPLLANLRADPRFGDFCKKVGIPPPPN